MRGILLSFVATGCLFASEVKLDTPQARAVYITVQPHNPATLGEPSMDEVLVFHDAGQVILRAPSGKTEMVEAAPGDAHWVPAGGPYTVESNSGHPIRIFEIQLKTKAQSAAPTSRLDPVVVDSPHYKVEFENDQVRVLRIHFGPMEKSASHEHMLNRVVCYLNDQGRTKAGDVRMSGPATHTEESTDDHPDDRIAVELKSPIPQK